MNKKILVLCEILFIIGASVFYFVKEVVPDLKEEFGSSDTLIKTDYYENMIELEIDEIVDFSLVINKEKKIYHLMFFDKNSVCLYNKNIENKSIEDGMLEIIKILISNNYLGANSIIKVTRYADFYYEEFKECLITVLREFNLDTNLIENIKTLGEKCEELRLNSNGQEAELLRDMDYYSKEFPRAFSGEVVAASEMINDDNSKSFTNNVYLKIEEYVNKNKLNTLARGNTELIINMIAADKDGKYYPSANSWYYVENGKVYAYIEIIDNNEKYGYCYKGSIDLNTKGEC